MAKKEFKWDSEKVITTITRGEKEVREVKECTLGDKLFIQITTKALIKGEWKVTKSYSIPWEVYTEMVEAVENHFAEEN